MGSSFSITNDTDGPIWVWNGANYDAVIWSVGGAVSLLTLGLTAGAGGERF